jgi:hypothetical protein
MYDDAVSVPESPSPRRIPRASLNLLSNHLAKRSHTFSAEGESKADRASGSDSSYAVLPDSRESYVTVVTSLSSDGGFDMPERKRRDIT